MNSFCRFVTLIKNKFNASFEKKPFWSYLNCQKMAH